MIKKVKPIANIKKIRDEQVKTALAISTSALMRAQKSPDEAFGELFNDVQSQRIYGDGKTFVDLIPRRKAQDIRKNYQAAKNKPDFNLREFVGENFYEFTPKGQKQHVLNEKNSPREHISSLWDSLERRNRINRGSLLMLPYKYIVPGGRFQEQFYWDSYFIMLGLARDGRWALIRGMIKNNVNMIRRFGFIPTGNRTYFLSRSQPPFFSHMIELLASHRGKTKTYVEYLPSLISEYRFWMKGRRSINNHAENQAFARVVKMPNGATLNRYYDDKTTPRPEMSDDDVENAGLSESVNKEKIYLDFRAAAESGWDFSSRWFRDPMEIRTIHTTDIVPIDLNCLLYHHEMIIADAYREMFQPIFSQRYREMARRRAATILKYCWDDKEKFFCDFDFRLGYTTGHITIAGVFPLYAGIATQEQAQHVADRIKKDFLHEGGVVTTLHSNGQQWDWPNGWAPMQWVTIMGLRTYGFHELADEIRDKWLAANEKFFAGNHKMLEKYNVVQAGSVGAGGEYPVQDGFGWTNGVYAHFKDEVDGLI